MNTRETEVISFKDSIVLSIAIAWDPARQEFVTVTATKFDDDQKPTSWAIRFVSRVMSKKTGAFDYESIPSSRDKKFFDEYRFEFSDEAIACWEKFHNP